MRQHAKRVLPADIYREFLEDIHDLEDIRIGVEKQFKVVERIRWAYAQVDPAISAFGCGINVV